jgi:hypothetical protein
VVSVPSPTYNDHFGERFADKIGHVRPGYTVNDMRAKLEKAGFRVRDWHYYTGPIAAKLCEHYYKDPMPEKVGWALMPLALAAALPAERGSTKRGASLALIVEAV